MGIKFIIKRGWRFLYLRTMIDKIKKNKHYFILGAPYHSNMGDQAQSYCLEKWAKGNYPNYCIWIFNTRELEYNNFELLKIIRTYIKSDDKITLHSGYHTTDIYMEEETLQREVIQLFPEYQIVIFPQTIFYKSSSELKKAEQIYNSHNNVLLMCRDEISYIFAQNHFSNCQLLKFPDIVTSMIGQKKYSYQRKGILLCLRNDQESILTNKDRETLVEHLSQIDYVHKTDTTISVDPKKISKNRKMYLEKMWELYSQYKIVITDRYHGTIFSLIANTPVLVLGSKDHKLSSGVKWFPDSFSDYIKFVPDLNTIIALVEEVYNATYNYSLPPYFQIQYYNMLKSYIEEANKNGDM